MHMRPSQLPSIREFMSRDYREDIQRLNQILHSSGDAGLVNKVPPIPFTGDIDSVEKGNCVCLIGINPLWSVKETKHVQEYLPAARMIESFFRGNEDAYVEYIKSRLNYFQQDYANTGHFNKPAMGYPLLYPELSNDDIWGRRAFAMDIIPYFSTNANKLNKKKIFDASKNDPAILSHQNMMKEIIIETNPSLLHLNGSHAIAIFEKLEYCEKPLVKLGELGRKYGLRSGYANIGDLKIKVLAHNQFAYGSSKTSDWPEFIRLWNESFDER